MVVCPEDGFKYNAVLSVLLFHNTNEFSLCREEKKKYLPHFIPLSTQSEFMSVSAKISSFNEKKKPIFSKVSI